MSEAKEKTPWRDGFWGADLDKGDMMIVKGSVVHGISMAEFVQYYAEFGQYYAGFETHETIGKYGKWTFGEFGKASTELEKFSHISQCNLKMALDFGRFGGTFIIYGILHPNGTKCCYQMGGSKQVYALRWLGVDDKKQILDNVEHRNERSHPFKVQPQNQGKLIFLSGPVFSGWSPKSAIALKLFQNEGFVFYKSNRGFDSFRNPYPNEKKRRWVRGWSKEKFEIIKVHNRQVHKGDAYAPFFKLLAKDVVSEKKKIGGDWIVTCAVPTRKLRDVIKKECNATFIVLTPSPEMLEKLSRKLPDPDYLMSLQKHFEGVQANEEDAFEVVLTPHSQDGNR